MTSEAKLKYCGCSSLNVLPSSSRSLTPRADGSGPRRDDSVVDACVDVLRALAEHCSQATDGRRECPLWTDQRGQRTLCCSSWLDHWHRISASTFTCRRLILHRQPNGSSSISLSSSVSHNFFQIKSNRIYYSTRTKMVTNTATVAYAVETHKSYIQ